MGYWNDFPEKWMQYPRKWWIPTCTLSTHFYLLQFRKSKIPLAYPQFGNASTPDPGEEEIRRIAGPTRIFESEYGLCGVSSSSIDESDSSNCSTIERSLYRPRSSPDNFFRRKDKCRRCAIFLLTSASLLAIVTAAIITINFTGKHIYLFFISCKHY